MGRAPPPRMLPLSPWDREVCLMHSECRSNVRLVTSAHPVFNRVLENGRYHDKEKKMSGYSPRTQATHNLMRSDSFPVSLKAVCLKWKCQVHRHYRKRTGDRKGFREGCRTYQLQRPCFHVCPMQQAEHLQGKSAFIYCIFPHSCA